MQERSIISGTTAVLLSEVLDFLYPLRWFALLAIILILVDLRFGLMAARARGDEIRTSRAGRRTMNKIVDYTCWILLAGAFGKAFGSPFGIEVLLPATVLLVIFGLEVNSCFSNYFEAHGQTVKVNIFKFFSRKTDIIEPHESRSNRRKVAQDSNRRDIA